jgi:hypothetical protein
MGTSTLLTPREAEQVVSELIEQFGLGSLPEVAVSVTPNGSWIVAWDTFSRTAHPMDGESWRSWLKEHVGPLDAESLQTTES